MTFNCSSCSKIFLLNSIFIFLRFIQLSKTWELVMKAIRLAAHCHILKTLQSNKPIWRISFSKEMFFQCYMRKKNIFSKNPQNNTAINQLWLNKKVKKNRAKALSNIYFWLVIITFFFRILTSKLKYLLLWTNWSKWRSDCCKRSRASPHIKSYARCSNDFKKVYWFLLTR